MVLSTQPCSFTQVELLMGISATLADFSDSLELAHQIPDFLGATLNLDALTLAIVREVPGEGNAKLILRSAAGIDCSGDSTPAFDQQILVIDQQTKPLAPTDGPNLRHAGDDADSPSQMDVERLGAFPRATVITRTLDPNHRMLLIVHQHAGDAALSTELIHILQMVGDQLSKLLGCLVTWHARSIDLGEPFNRLTEREWMVLRGLNTEAGEKQLADQLGLSPHTLHSHIKSIYRKIGVQGRLPLLTKVQAALRALRAGRAAPKIALKVPMSAEVVAVG